MDRLRSEKATYLGKWLKFVVTESDVETVVGVHNRKSILSVIIRLNIPSVEVFYYYLKVNEIII